MESVTDCWLCRLVIDQSGERCFSRAATVLWKPQEQAREGEEIQIKHQWCRWKFVKNPMTASPFEENLDRIGGGGWLDRSQHCFSLNWSTRVQTPCCKSSMLRHVAPQHATTYGFQIGGWRRQDEYKLETACCDRFGSCWHGLLWLRGKNIYSMRTEANTGQEVIEPWFSSMFARIFYTFHHLFHPTTTQTLLSHTNTQLFVLNWIFV